MKDIALVILFLLPCCLCVLGAVYIAVTGSDGWGWFLFVAVLLGSVKYNSTGASKP